MLTAFSKCLDIRQNIPQVMVTSRSVAHVLGLSRHFLTFRCSKPPLFYRIVANNLLMMDGLSNSADTSTNLAVEKCDKIKNEQTTLSGNSAKPLGKDKQMKRKQGRGRATNHPKKRRKFLQDQSYANLSQYVDNGMRKIKPYHFRFETHAKGRWLGKSLIDVFRKEFRLETPEYYKAAINGGLVTLNGKRVTADTIIRSQDFIQSRVHRHEPPVSGQPLDIIEQTEDFLVINKPASIPIHPAGKYRHNSIVYLMAKEHGIQGLHTFYRLDRLTSGVFIFAKSTEMVKKIDSQMRGRQLHKVYLCKAYGEFPSEPVECEEPILAVSHKIGVCRVSSDGKPAKTVFQRVSFDGKTSIIKCSPHTGRMHQIRVHLQYLGYPVVNDPLYTGPIWGPDQGKEGKIPFANNEEFVAELIRLHNAEQLRQPPSQRDNSAAAPGSERSPSEEPMVGSTKTSDNVITSGQSLPPQPDIPGSSAPISQESHCAISTIQTDDRTRIVQDEIATSSFDVCSNAQGKDQAGMLNTDSVASSDGTKSYQGSDQDSNTDTKSMPLAITTLKQAHTCVSASSEAQGLSGPASVVNATAPAGKLNSEDPTAKVSHTDGDVASGDRDCSSKFEGPAEEEDPEEEAMNKLALELCRECQNPLADPKPEDMMLYLHALTYKGPDFDFSTPLPNWAQEHMDRTGSKMP